MLHTIGLPGPARVNDEQWLTIRDCKRVLVVASTLTYAQRLLDVFRLLESDWRIQVVFTVAPHPFGEGVARFLQDLGCPVLPWEEAVRSEFDLSLASGWEDIERVPKPLVLLSHGAGHIKLARVWTRTAAAERPPGMFSRDNIARDGRVVPSVIGLAHHGERETLARSCPEALPMTTVVGDPAYDRLLASLPHREAYRAALGVEDGQQLLVVTSTWGRSASFGRLDNLLHRLVGELPRPQFRTAVLTHPNVWAGHGWWQVRAWLARYRRRGVALVPPEADWRPLLAAADWIIGDHGSVTSYATLTSAPIVLARYPHSRVHRASPAAALATTAPALTSVSPLGDQLRYARAEYRREEFEAVAMRITSKPGEFNANMRRLMYRLMGIGEPAFRPLTEPVPLPPSLDCWTGDAPGVAE
ncbi:hypothetical protein [Streptomyces sp. NPDC127098]|uniref:hypothetical protein n=1 Tax=Streptomyces sp. NPDC127098 TaxID=3347137 RepID=UPI003662664F